ncbi:MAG: type II toxin-antitoxin system mRNA interferase toxin, RelE/StbE family [Proteobacteria bacterium]|nr:MAG: type II toxin-antitoxin system mRNA interferase toxin, RelE/StbE family [Pseudomonadota bacterium]
MLEVELTSKAKKDLKKLPENIVFKFQRWLQLLSLYGLEETRKIPGFHDEPLKGDRKGQRSIRLNKAYRAIYFVSKNGEITLLEVIEVNKHDY